MADLQKNLTRLRAISYKLGTIKYTIDCIIARLEAKPLTVNTWQNDYDDLYHEHISKIDDMVDDLKARAGEAISEVKTCQTN